MSSEQAPSPIVEELRRLKDHVHPPVPNPAPLGLIGFGLTTALLQMKHTRIAGDSVDEMNGVDNITLGFAMFFGGLLQVSTSRECFTLFQSHLIELLLMCTL